MADDNLSSQLVDAVTANTVDLMRVSTGIRDQIFVMLKELETELTHRIEANATDTGLTAMRLRTLLAQTKDTIATYYGDISNTHLKDLQGVAKATALNVRNAVNENVGVNLFSVAFTKDQLETLAKRTMMDGVFSQEWWAKQAPDLQRRFTSEMRLGMLQGDTMSDLIRRLRGRRENNFSDGLMQIPYNQAETLVRTSVVNVANMTRLESYMQNADLIKAIQWVSTLDDRTTEICIALDGCLWSLPSDHNPANFGGYTPIDHDKEFPGPTAHWNCRSTQIPVLFSFNEIKGPNAWKLPDGSRADLADLFQQKLQNKGFSAEEAKSIEMDTRASMDGQVAQTQGFEGWLKGKPEAFQNELLGKTAAGLWRQGSVALSDLTSQDNRPLSVAELTAKAAGTTPPAPLVSPAAADAVSALESIHATAQESMDNLRGAITKDFEDERKQQTAAFDAWNEARATLNALPAELRESDPLVKDAIAKLDEARAKWVEANQATGQALARTRARLEVPAHDRSFTNVQSISNDINRLKSINEARDILDKIAVASIKEKPNVWMSPSQLTRSNFSVSDNMVNLTADAGTKIALHELGHWIEANHPETFARLIALREERTFTQPLQDLGKLMNHPDYKGEFGKQALTPEYPAWLSNYMGKYYVDSSGKDYATEILSVGLEWYWFQPQQLINQDPELFDFLYRVLRNLDPLPTASVSKSGIVRINVLQK
jgi:SPP1 gp7 family putative phage head morphogenesis protein